jgi:hypothetical protein
MRDSSSAIAATSARPACRYASRPLTSRRRQDAVRRTDTNQEALAYDYRYQGSQVIPSIPFFPTLGVKGSF